MRRYTCLLLGLLALGADPARTADSLDKYFSRLPAQVRSRPAGPREYLFICDYFSLDAKGDLSGKQRVSGVYTHGLPENAVRWNRVAMARAKGLDDPFPAGEPREFMEGFTYRLSAAADLLKPEFFQRFPPAAIMERNLVWDVYMLEMFARDYFDKLSLNTPYRMKEEQVPLAGAGSFQNKQLELTWTGISRRNGQNCALIHYEALFNKFQVTTPVFVLTGRSHYWGEIWVSLSGRQIEFATLYEDVLGEQKTQGQPEARLVNVFRKATLAPGRGGSGAPVGSAP